MAFTTQTFTFAFCPICILFYYLINVLQNKGVFSKFLSKIRATDLVLIAISLAFYSWVCLDIFKFLIYILIVYICGKVIEKNRNSGIGLNLTKHGEATNKSISIACVLMLLSVALVVYILVHFKYLNLFAQVWNFFLNDSVESKSIIAPLGISFITFSAISYLVDIYKNKADSGNFIDCTLYLSFFPKVVSGPIVLWRDFNGQIMKRKITFDGISDGMSRIMIGFAKKLILADTFGLYISKVNGVSVDMPTAWGISLLYMLQIFFDFSGYSDIAIGLAKMLGFEFKENFNFPYISTSITEFWRRWHISLGTWFREYIYFPLGGSRVNKTRTLINIGVVFVLTGIWHGAGWTYMLWGIINGVCNMSEKVLADKKIYKSTPSIIKWIGTMAVTFFCWELFRFTNFTDCLNWFKILFGITTFEAIPYTWQYYFDSQIITLTIIGILGSTVFGLPKIQNAYNRLIATKTGYAIQQAVFIVLFLVSILFMVNSTYSPFIYFQY